MVLSIIIVNFNSGDILEKCVTSLYAYEKNVEFEIIIVDQNSKDNSKEIIEDTEFEDYTNRFDRQFELMKLRRNVDIRIEPHVFKFIDNQSNNPFVQEIMNKVVELKLQ